MELNNNYYMSRSTINLPLYTAQIVYPTICGAKWGSHSEVFIPLYVTLYTILTPSPFGNDNQWFKPLTSTTITYPLLLTLDNFPDSFASTLSSRTTIYGWIKWGHGPPYFPSSTYIILTLLLYTHIYRIYSTKWYYLLTEHEIQYHISYVPICPRCALL